GEDVLQRLEIARRLDLPTTRERPAAGQADALGDREQPRLLELRDDASLEAAERVQERRLRGVLGLFAAAEPVQAEGQYLAAVAFVQLGRAGARQDCGQCVSPWRISCRSRTRY